MNTKLCAILSEPNRKYILITFFPCAVYFPYNSQRISPDFNKKFKCFY